MTDPCLPQPCQVAIVGVGGGIGRALATSLATNHQVVGFARQPKLMRNTGSVAALHAIDITSEESVAAAAATFPSNPPLRLVIVTTGLLHDAVQQPEKSLRALDFDHLARSFAVNTIGPALVAKHMLRKVPREGRSVFAVLSARVGSIGDNRLGGWYGYRASKAALNQMMRTLAIEMRRSHPDLIVAALHPGTVATALSEPFRGQVDSERLFTPAQAADHLLRTIGELTPADSGGFFAWNGQAIPF